MHEHQKWFVVVTLPMLHWISADVFFHFVVWWTKCKERKQTQQSGECEQWDCWEKFVKSEWVVWRESDCKVGNTSAYILVCLLADCLTSQQHASVSQGRICTDNFACCHTEVEVADQTFHLTQSQYTDTGPTSPSADPITPGAWQGSHWSANV